jgi:hypothetical protein
MRTLREIALDIKKNWKNPYFGAVPYIDTMLKLRSIEDNYYYDDARSIVMYFLGNAQTFRGEDARRIKLELKSMLK